MVNVHPYHIRKALQRISIASSEVDAYLSLFISRWGGVESMHFQQALLASQAEDSAFAATALYFRGDQLWIQQEGVKLLQHTNPWIQWAIALSFGEEQKKVALPVLCALLTDKLSLVEFTDPSRTQFRGWRISLSRIVVEYEDSATIVPSLKYALKATNDIELQAQENGITDIKLASIRSAQMHYVYGLGRLKAWGALLGITQDIARLHQWVVLMICGALHRKFEAILLKDWGEYPEFHQAVKKRLGSFFGFFEDAQNLILREFESDASNMRFIYFQTLDAKL